jgi:SOS response associated peptidase (SRAP)
MPHDRTPAGGTAEQQPAVAIGAALEIVDEEGHLFGFLLERRPGSYHTHHVWTILQLRSRGIYGPAVPDGEPLPNLEPTWTMAPMKDAPVARLYPNGGRHRDVLKWGLVPYCTKGLKSARKPINGRSETVATSRMFRAPFAKRCCLVPAAAYYKWRDDPEGKTLFTVARVWTAIRLPTGKYGRNGGRPTAKHCGPLRPSQLTRTRHRPRSRTGCPSS